MVTKIAYADWTRAGEYSRTLTQHAIRLVQRNLTPGGDKNGADINLALDALEMAFTHQHINAYVIVGGDSDFLSLVEKLKQYDKKVFVVGGRAFTSVILQRNCHEFIAYENLHRVPEDGGEDRPPDAGSRRHSPIAQAFPIVRRALKILADREVSPQTGLLKSTLLQLDSTFSERNYGASSFLDFVEKLSQAGLVQLKHAGRSVMVELNNQFDEAEAGSSDSKMRGTLAGGDAGIEPSSVAPPSSPGSGYAEPRRSDSIGALARPNDQAGVSQPPSPTPFYGEPRRSDGGAGGFRPVQEQPALDVPRATEPPADGVKRVADVLNAATTARWPMYLRNVKQLLRASDGAFDERRYGFSGLVELVRACQKDGLVRLERDRRGGLRVFPGPALQLQRGAETAPPSRALPAEMNGNVQIESERPRPTERPAWEAEAAAAAESHESGDVDLLDNEPMPTSDPTAELLGTGARRKRVSRAPAPAPARRAPKAAARKPAAATPRKSRAKKSAAEPR